MNPRRSAAAAVLAVLGGVLIALWVSGVTTAGGYPVYLALAALVVVVGLALVVALLVLFFLARRWL